MAGEARDGLRKFKSVTAMPASPSAIPSVNVAVRGGEVLILGLTHDPLSITPQTAERLAKSLMDAVAVSRGQLPGSAQA